MRAAAAVLLTFLLAGCASEAPVQTPAMYLNMAEAGAKLDPVAALSWSIPRW
jgi:outer membrane murein-binding lipoprotein Lpp